MCGAADKQGATLDNDTKRQLWRQHRVALAAPMPGQLGGRGGRTTFVKVKEWDLRWAWTETGRNSVADQSKSASIMIIIAIMMSDCRLNRSSAPQILTSKIINFSISSLSQARSSMCCHHLPISFHCTELIMWDTFNTDFSDFVVVVVVVFSRLFLFCTLFWRTLNQPNLHLQLTRGGVHCQGGGGGKRAWRCLEGRRRG